MMKPGSIFSLLLMIAGFGYVAAGPYITVDQITTGIEEQDWQQLSDNIDFPRVRENIKNQISNRIKKKSSIKAGDDSFDQIAPEFTSSFVDGIVDSFVTPSALASLMSGEKPLKKTEAGVISSEIEKGEPFRNAIYSYDSIDHFSVWVPNDNGGNAIRFVLYRDGIKWKLSNIVIPAEYKI